MRRLIRCSRQHGPAKGKKRAALRRGRTKAAEGGGTRKRGRETSRARLRPERKAPSRGSPAARVVYTVPALDLFILRLRDPRLRIVPRFSAPTVKAVIKPRKVNESPFSAGSRVHAGVRGLGKSSDSRLVPPLRSLISAGAFSPARPWVSDNFVMPRVLFTLSLFIVFVRGMAAPFALLCRALFLISGEKFNSQF